MTEVPIIDSEFRTAFTLYNFFKRKRPVSNLSEAELNAYKILPKVKI